jgi:hypothetical protein
MHEKSEESACVAGCGLRGRVDLKRDEMNINGGFLFAPGRRLDRDLPKEN